MKTKILKIQWGVNPNSSSIGMSLHVFFLSAIAITFVVNAVLLVFYLLKKGKK